ncbi:branched-chain amino acid aminotransferase [Micromonospora siamensis]|uniref:Branched-chain-amino-acid aminotransferase n=1 Tax=Micromonospora siamensis TaxID=299152 RepID=A0A1C5J8A5_9ACTN|nr:branched-chain amino acid aminotransferase [Micromonospora siamensis]SCG66743.1 branched-chain amino acid aminotransferase [Micromonospora siamensis]
MTNTDTAVALGAARVQPPSPRSQAPPHASSPAGQRPTAAEAASGHGDRFTGHMFSIEYEPGAGWRRPELLPLGSVPLHPGTVGLHYGQAIFEGLKAFRQPDGSIAVFRPRDNARRFQRSAARLAMPPLPEAMFLDAIERLVAADASALPADPAQSLYLRPLMFATDTNLMLKPSERYRFLLMAFVAGGFFGAGVDAISVRVNHNHARAMPGGTGDVKIAGNYAPTFPAQIEAERAGCQQVLWLDSTENRWIEEMSGMNLFLVAGRGHRTEIVTSPLTGTLLPGVTRDTVLRLAARLGYGVREERIALSQWRDGSGPGGRFTEAFACGTAAVITSVRDVRDAGGDWIIGDGQPGPVTTTLRKALTNVQRGRVPDTEGWLHPVPRTDLSVPARTCSP